MQYYNEDRYKKKDKSVALIATAIYIVVLVLCILFVKLDPPEVAPTKKLNNMVLMDFGKAEIPAPNVASKQKPKVTKVKKRKEIETPKPEDKSKVKGVIKSEKVVDTTEMAPPRKVNINALYAKKTSVSEKLNKTEVVSNVSDGGSLSGMKNSTGSDKEGLFSLDGRTLVGELIAPIYNDDTEGRIIIDINVNREGEVTQASFNPNNSTISNAQMIESSRKAALQTRFSRNTNALFVQSGTITYYFNLK